MTDGLAYTGANVEAIGLSSQVEVLTSITEDPLVQVVSKHPGSMLRIEISNNMPVQDTNFQPVPNEIECNFPATPDSFLDGLNMFEFLLEEACFNMNELCQGVRVQQNRVLFWPYLLYCLCSYLSMLWGCAGLQCIFLNFLFVMSKTW